MMPRGVPDGLDADTAQRVLRSFLLVRMARGSLLLVFLAIALVAVELKGWPSGVMVAIGVAILGQAGALVALCRRYASAGRGCRHSASP
jgi:hypothetical protein